MLVIVQTPKLLESQYWDLNKTLTVSTTFYMFMLFVLSFLTVDEPVKEFTLPAYAQKTSIRDLTTDVDYEVTISSYSGSQESIPLSGQITSKSCAD